MDARATTGLLRFFHEITDYRAGNLSHSLANIIAIAVMGVICGQQSWMEVEAWAVMHQDWLSGFLDLRRGVPSHDTLDRVFRHLDPLQFEKCFNAWSRELVGAGGGLFVAVDGKTLRRSWKRAWSKTPVHLVSAFVAKNHLVLGQLATDAKSNEITAIPQLLALLELAGCTLTIDAMGCQRDIAAQIRAQGGHYLLAVKDNQPTLHEKVKKLLDEAILEGFKGMEHGYHQESDSGHGRIQTRRVWVSNEVKWLGKELLGDWAGLSSVIVVESRRQDLGDLSGKISTERRYYISDHAHVDAKFFAQGIRQHWGIESMHWTLDVTMNEDQCRLRMDHGAENLGRLRRLVQGNLKRWQPMKPNGKPLRVGVAIRQKMCNWNPNCIFQVLGA